MTIAGIDISYYWTVIIAIFGWTLLQITSGFIKDYSRKPIENLLKRSWLSIYTFTDKQVKARAAKVAKLSLDPHEQLIFSGANTNRIVFASLFIILAFVHPSDIGLVFMVLGCFLLSKFYENSSQLRDALRLAKSAHGAATIQDC